MEELTRLIDRLEQDQVLSKEAFIRLIREHTLTRMNIFMRKPTGHGRNIMEMKSISGA